MRYFLAVLTVALIAGSASAWSEPEEILLVPQLVYLPQGFDNNDSIEIYIEGHLPSTCYKVGPIRATPEVDANGKRIIIENVSYQYPSFGTEPLCLPSLVEYDKKVRIGLLKEEGVYEILFKNDNGQLVKKGELPVGVATSRLPDEYLYAPVKELSLEKTSQGFDLVMKGAFYSTCMEIKSVDRVFPPQNASRVIDVLPRVRQNTSVPCKQERRPFEERISFQTDLTGRFLIHVRSMNGNALFKSIDL